MLAQGTRARADRLDDRTGSCAECHMGCGKGRDEAAPEEVLHVSCSLYRLLYAAYSTLVILPLASHLPSALCSRASFVRKWTPNQSLSSLARVVS